MKHIWFLSNSQKDKNDNEVTLIRLSQREVVHDHVAE